MMNYFDAIEFLEPKCPNCGIKLDYGLNTEFREEINSQVCIKCGSKV